MNHPEIRESLLMFAQTLDPILQKVVVKIIFCMMDTKELKYVEVLDFRLAWKKPTVFHVKQQRGRIHIMTLTRQAHEI